MIHPIKIRSFEAACLPPGMHKIAELMEKRLHYCYDCGNPNCKCRKQDAWAYVHSFNGNQYVQQRLL